jgi:hypothetical protein
MPRMMLGQCKSADLNRAENMTPPPVLTPIFLEKRSTLVYTVDEMFAELQDIVGDADTQGINFDFDRLELCLRTIRKPLGRWAQAAQLLYAAEQHEHRAAIFTVPLRCLPLRCLEESIQSHSCTTQVDRP